MGKYTKMSQQVLEKVGGLSNITFVEHCATRLRIHYASKSKVDVEAIKGIENVVGVVAKTGQVQIIIGPEVNDAFNDFLDVSGWKPTDDRPAVVEEEPEKKNALYYVNKFGNFCAGIFMPIVPALITGGLILAVKNLLVNYFGMSTDSGTAKICLAIFSAGFSMLPVWIGYTLSNKLKMEPIMGAFLGAVLVSNSISGVEGLDFFGIPIPTVTYTSSVLPIVMGVILMYWVDKLLKKIIPEMVRYFLKPLLTMLIVVPITLIVLGPIGTELSGVVGNAIQAFFNAAGFIALAVAMHLKDKGRKGMVASFGVTALCGVTEPAFYGSLIMRPRVLIGTACGAVAGGLIAGIFQLKNYVVGGCPGFLALLFFLPSDGSMGNLILALVSGIVTVIVSFIACTIVLKKAYKEDV